MSAYVPLLVPFAFAWTTYIAIKVDDDPEAAMTQIIGFLLSVWLLTEHWSLPWP